MTSEDRGRKTWVFLAHLAIVALVVYGLWLAKVYLFGGSTVAGTLLFAVVLFVGIGHIPAWRFARQLAVIMYLLTAILTPYALFSPFGADEPSITMWQLIALMLVLVALCLAFVWALTRPWMLSVSSLRRNND